MRWHGELLVTVEPSRVLVTIAQACEIVGVSRRTIYNWIAGNKVEYVRTVGGSIRIFADSLFQVPKRAYDFKTCPQCGVVSPCAVHEPTLPYANA